MPTPDATDATDNTQAAAGSEPDPGAVAVTGEEPPEPNDPDVPTGQAIAWVVAVAVGVGLSQVLINRFAAKRWSAFTGEGQSSRPVNLRF